VEPDPHDPITFAEDPIKMGPLNSLSCDPSYSPAALVERAQAQRLKVVCTLNTHVHPDPVDGGQGGLGAVGLTGQFSG
jgi:hypothetical protein